MKYRGAHLWPGPLHLPVRLRRDPRGAASLCAHARGWARTAFTPAPPPIPCIWAALAPPQHPSLHGAPPPRHPGAVGEPSPWHRAALVPRHLSSASTPGVPEDGDDTPRERFWTNHLSSSGLAGTSTQRSAHLLALSVLVHIYNAFPLSSPAAPILTIR